MADGEATKPRELQATSIYDVHSDGSSSSVASEGLEVGQLPIPTQDWAADRVLSWLASDGLQGHELAAFEGLDGHDLLALTEVDMLLSSLPQLNAAGLYSLLHP